MRNPSNKKYKQFTIFISNKELDYYKKSYIKQKLSTSNHTTYFIHLEEFYCNGKCYAEIKDLCSEAYIINILLVVHTSPPRYSNVFDLYKAPGMNLETLCTKIHSLNNRSIYKILVDSCFGVHTHTHILQFPKDSQIITLSDYNESTYRPKLLYDLAQSYTLSEILRYFIHSYENMLRIPSIYISKNLGLKCIIYTGYDFIDTSYHAHLDFVSLLDNPSLKDMSDIFITNGLLHSNIEDQITHWMSIKPRLFSEINHKHPITLTKEVNNIFNTYKNSELCKETIKNYFYQLYKTNPYNNYWVFRTNNFNLKLRLNLAFINLFKNSLENHQAINDDHENSV